MQNSAKWIFVGILFGLFSAFTYSRLDVNSASFVHPTSSLVAPTSAFAEDAKPTLDTSNLGEPLPRNLFVELGKAINPAVVSIFTSQNIQQRRGIDPFQDFFEDFWGGGGGRNPFGGGGAPPPQQAQGLGTGFIIRADGLIITNNHVVEKADIIKVQLDNNTEKFYEAKVIGRDKRTDIALIKIEAKKPLPVAPLGSSKNLQVGEWVAAFGNPYGHAHTMTKGIISAIGREIAELNRFPFIQTDASINPGNSGGPLVNTQGFVIGVNTAIDARAQGIGFAIPIDNVKSIVAELEKSGSIKRGYIGIVPTPVTPDIAAQLGLQEASGIVVVRTLEGGPAEKAGVRVMDIMTELNGKKIHSTSDLLNIIADIPIGTKAKAKIMRFDNDKRSDLSVDILVAENPEDAGMSRQKVSGGEGVKKYSGQKAPFDIGFKVADLNSQLREDFDIPDDAPTAPIIIDVEANSIAARTGLRPGDLLLDVNGKKMQKAVNVLSALQRGRNMIRVLRGGMYAVVIFQIR